MSPSTLPSTFKSSLPVISPFKCKLAPSRAAAPLDGVDGYIGSLAICFASQFCGSVFAGVAAHFSGTADFACSPGRAGSPGRACSLARDGCGFLSLLPHIWPSSGSQGVHEYHEACFRLRDSESSLCSTPAQQKISRKVSRQAPVQTASLPSFITALVGWKDQTPKRSVECRILITTSDRAFKMVRKKLDHRLAILRWLSLFASNL